MEPLRAYPCALMPFCPLSGVVRQLPFPGVVCLLAFVWRRFYGETAM